MGLRVKEQSKAILLLQGATMGLVSGIKGGATAGALGGAAAMLFSMADKPTVIMIFTLIVGITFGGMGGAVIGAGQGIGAGGLSRYLEQHGRAYRWVWLVTAVLLGCLVGWLMSSEYGLGALLLGGFCGVVSGWLSQRDFGRVLALQESEGEGD